MDQYVVEACEILDVQFCDVLNNYLVE